MNEAVTHFLVKITKHVLLFLILLLVASMVFGSAHLAYYWGLQLLSPSPLYFVLDINEIFSIYEKILIIVVGYELVKSIVIIIHSNKIPFIEILQIAVIAVANKVITLDLHKTDFYTMIGLASIIISIGLAYFLFNRYKAE